MNYDFNDLLKRPPTRERKQLVRDEANARWADYGRSVYINLMASNTMEQVVFRMQLRGATSCEIARAIRVYLTTGALP